MNKAIERLNEVVEKREGMIYAILDSKSLSDVQYDHMEERLMKLSFAELKKRFDKINIKKA